MLVYNISQMMTKSEAPTHVVKLIESLMSIDIGNVLKYLGSYIFCICELVILRQFEHMNRKIKL
jgi:hypothetical protein